MPAVIAKLVAQPGKRDELVGVLTELLHAVENEPGTLTYIMHTCEAEPDAVYFYETYADDAAKEAHGKSDAMRTAGKALAAILAGRPEITSLEEIARKGA
jgi:quinol monooxygenase YgiN